MAHTSFWEGKRILVTGGTGTFGRAFIKRLISISEIERIVVFSRDEFKQNEMRHEIKDPRVDYFIGDVRDLARLERAFNGIDIVVHAAALKQVPALEYNPLEAVKTNIIGTQNVIDAALDRDVGNVILISSDKAVYPVNLYGATKLTAERLVIASNAYRGKKGKTKFSVVRYGNVIGSRGSFVELIEKQKPSGIITITHEHMTRFWIHIDDVTKIVTDILKCMEGGELFIPKMKSLKVVDVVEMLAPKCQVEIIGIRPGEKLHEMLVTEHEVERTKDAGDFYVVLPEFRSWKTKDIFAKNKSFPKGVQYVSNDALFLVPGTKAKSIFKL